MVANAVTALADHPIPHRVKRSAEGKLLREYLHEVVPKRDRDGIDAAIAEGRFRWRGEDTPLTADAPMRPGETLLADVPDITPDDPFLPPPPEVLTELLRDEGLLVIDKPPGLLSYPLGPRKIAAQSIAQRQLAADGIEDPLRPLHRIDRETSGILMFARTLEADQRIKKAFRKRWVRKSYLAIVRGHLPGGMQKTVAPIGPDGGEIRMKMAVRDDGKPAETWFKTLGWFGDTDFGEAGPGYTWVEARPVTGRAHQIRVHLAHLGHPIVGDKMYCDGGEAFLAWWDGALDQAAIDALGMPRQALHAWTLAVRHPIHGEPIWLEAPPPADMLAFAEEHGGDAPPSPMREEVLQTW